MTESPDKYSCPSNDQITLLLDDWSFIVTQLAKVTGLLEKEVRQKLIRELDELGANVCEAVKARGLKPHVWSDDLEDFYASTDSFLFETLIWAHCESKKKMRNWILRFLRCDGRSGARLLTHGDGLGIDSCYFAQEGYKVDYYEVSDQCVRFSQGLAKNTGLTIHNLYDMEAIPEASYDYIVQLDVLEHAPSPQELVKSLSRLLVPGGRLIIHAPFWQTDYFLPTHLVSNQKYSGDLAGIFKPFGLEPIADTFMWMPIVFEKVVEGSFLSPIPLSNRLSIALNQVIMRSFSWNNFLILRIARRVSVGERRAIRKRALALLST
jgi:2-polyprenyl-3-methyl-5-hydroxy-6-metoxy-1,4-benzoquinol methylase